MQNTTRLTYTAPQLLQWPWEGEALPLEAPTLGCQRVVLLLMVLVL